MVQGEKPSAQVIPIKSARREREALVLACRRMLVMAERGEIQGMAGVVHLGGNVFEYTGEGTFVANPLLGYGASARLMQKFL